MRLTVIHFQGMTPEQKKRAEFYRTLKQMQDWLDNFMSGLDDIIDREVIKPLTPLQRLSVLGQKAKETLMVLNGISFSQTLLMIGTN